MNSVGITFDHIHIISKEPRKAADWYVHMLGGVITREGDVKGAPQIYVAFDGATIIIRGLRAGEDIAEKTGRQWGVDHFGFLIKENFDGFCDKLRSMGVRFNLDPMDFNPTTRIAYIHAPDGVIIELVYRKAMEQ